MEKLKKFLKSKNIKNSDSKINNKFQKEEEKLSLKNLRMNRLLGKFEKEIVFLKAKNPVSRNRKLEGKYESQKREMKNYAYYTAEDFTLSLEEWRNAFEYFCKKTENIYGLKVDRSNLIWHNREHCQAVSPSGDGTKTGA